jgi:hypothetical protein
LLHRFRQITPHLPHLGCKRRDEVGYLRGDGKTRCDPIDDQALTLRSDGDVIEMLLSILNVV